MLTRRELWCLVSLEGYRTKATDYCYLGITFSLAGSLAVAQYKLMSTC